MNYTSEPFIVMPAIIELAPLKNGAGIQESLREMDPGFRRGDVAESGTVSMK